NPYTILTANSATNVNTRNKAAKMRSTTEPFIRRDKYAPRAPTNGSTRYGMLMNWNLFLSKGNKTSIQQKPKNNRQDAAPGNQTFLICKSMGVPCQDTDQAADLARIDRKRKKKGSNDEWKHPHDPDAKITKMKDGRTHLAHKAEHAIDLETGAI